MTGVLIPNDTDAILLNFKLREILLRLKVIRRQLYFITDIKLDIGDIS